MSTASGFDKSESIVMSWIDNCEKQGAVAGMGWSKKLLQRAAYNLATKGHIVFVRHETHGSGWIKFMSLESFTARGFVFMTEQSPPYANVIER